MRRPRARRANAAYAAAMEQVGGPQFPDRQRNRRPPRKARDGLCEGPWDYWQAGGAEAEPQKPAAIVGRRLDRGCWRADPSHRVQVNYYIHAVGGLRPGPQADRTCLPRQGGGFGVCSGRQDPGLPDHLGVTNMPSHIFTTVGRYTRDALARIQQKIATRPRR